MNWRAIRTIIGKDLRVVRQSRAVMIPLVSVPIILLLVIPLVAGIAINVTDPNDPEITSMQSDLSAFYDNLPTNIADELAAFDNELQRTAYLFFVYLFAPLFLILPIMVANVIAADSFVGERERKTLEALLYTPVSDSDLYIAKLLSPWIAALAVTFIGFIMYAIVINVILYPALERVFFPNITWLIMVIWLAPAAAGLGLGAMVLVSSRVSTFQEAYQLGGMIVLPVIVLLISQLGGVLYLSPLTVIVLGFGVWLVDAGIFWYGIRIFERGELISRL